MVLANGPASNFFANHLCFVFYFWGKVVCRYSLLPLLRQYKATNALLFHFRDDSEYLLVEHSRLKAKNMELTDNSVLVAKYYGKFTRFI